MNRRTTTLTAICGVGTALALVAAATPAASARDGAGSTGRPVVTKLPQSTAVADGSGLTRSGHRIYFLMTNAADRSTLGRVDQDLDVRLWKTGGSAYLFAAPTRTSDGGVWTTLQSTAGVKGITAFGVGRTGKTRTAVGSTLNVLSGWPSAADGHGRFWSQGYVPDKGIALLGAGRTRSTVVRTRIGPVSSSTDLNLNNPLVKGPDGRVWLLGGDGDTAFLRIASVGAHGIRKDIAPKGLSVGSLALTRAGGRLWTVAARDSGRLVAFAVSSDAPATRVPTTAYAECQLTAAKPVGDGKGGLWFTGADAACSADAQLLLVKVGMKGGVSTSRPTGLTVLGASASSVVPAGDGVLAAGLDGDGDLAFVRAGATTQTISTTVEPYLDESQARYPIVSDKRNGAWAQAVDAAGNLVVVHVAGTKQTQIATGLRPVARDLVVGPDRSLWTQGVRADGKLVIVKVRPDGTVTKVQTGLAPTDVVVGPTYDGAGHLWFEAAKPATGQLVLVRVRTR